MKNKKIFELFDALSSITGLPGVRFNYAVAKNLATLKAEVTALQEGLKATEEFTAYDKERVELATKHAKKNENGEAIMEKVGKAEQFVIEDLKAFEKDFEVLKETHKLTIEAREKQLKDFEKLLEEENPIVLHKIKLSDVPEAMVTEQLVSIYSLIEE